MQQLTAGKIAKLAGINVETLRYYEKRDLLPTPVRNASGYRMYPTDIVTRLQFIKGAQSLGFTLAEISNLLDLRLDEAVDRASVRQHAQEKIQNIDEKISSLQTMRTALVSLVEQCHTKDTNSDCPILDGIASVKKRQPTQ